MRPLHALILVICLVICLCIQTQCHLMDKDFLIRLGCKRAIELFKTENELGRIPSADILAPIWFKELDTDNNGLLSKQEVRVLFDAKKRYWSFINMGYFFAANGFDKNIGLNKCEFKLAKEIWPLRRYPDLRLQKPNN